MHWTSLRRGPRGTPCLSRDAELLYQARYGKQDKMTKEQYAALKRKVGGTAANFFKTSVEAQGQYVEKGYESTEASSVPGLPFLAAVIVALFGTVAYVVSQTGGTAPLPPG
eukprot:jgi/Astpho2/8537/Aster-05571